MKSSNFAILVSASLVFLAHGVNATEKKPQELALQKDLAANYTQVLAVAGGFNNQQLQTIEKAIATHFDLSDPVIQEYIAGRKADFACMASKAQERRQMCEAMDDQRGRINQCVVRQKEIQGELKDAGAQKARNEGELKACQEIYQQQVADVDARLSQSIDGWFAAIAKFKRMCLTNRVGRYAISAGRTLVPASCSLSVAYSAYAPCVEGVLGQCASHLTSLTPYLTLGIGLGTGALLQMLHNSGEEVLVLLKEKERRKGEFEAEERKLREKLAEIEAEEERLSQENAKKLEEAEQRIKDRTKIEQERDRLDAQIAGAVQTRLKEMGMRNLQVLEDALEEPDQSNKFVHKTAVAQLQNLLDGTITSLAIGMNYGETKSLEAPAKEQIGTIELFEDETKE